MSHQFHDALKGYDPRQILISGCEACEERGRDLRIALLHLDTRNFRRAWRRAYDREASQGNYEAVGPVSAAEAPLLDILYAIQVQIERAGGPYDGALPFKS